MRTLSLVSGGVSIHMKVFGRFVQRKTENPDCISAIRVRSASGYEKSTVRNSFDLSKADFRPFLRKSTRIVNEILLHRRDSGSWKHKDSAVKDKQTIDCQTLSCKRSFLQPTFAGRQLKPASATRANNPDRTGNSPRHPSSIHKHSHHPSLRLTPPACQVAVNR